MRGLEISLSLGSWRFGGLINRLQTLRKDEDWHRNVTVRIGPHPQLSIPQRKAIERDFDMENGEKAFEVNAAFAFYLLQRLGLDRDSETKPAEARQIVLMNPDELDSFRGAIRNTNQACP